MFHGKVNPESTFTKSVTGKKSLNKMNFFSIFIGYYYYRIIIFILLFYEYGLHPKRSIQRTVTEISRLVGAERLTGQISTDGGIIELTAQGEKNGRLITIGSPDMYSSYNDVHDDEPTTSAAAARGKRSRIEPAANADGGPRKEIAETVVGIEPAANADEGPRTEVAETVVGIEPAANAGEGPRTKVAETLVDIEDERLMTTNEKQFNAGIVSTIEAQNGPATKHLRSRGANLIVTTSRGFLETVQFFIPPTIATLKLAKKEQLITRVRDMRTYELIVALEKFNSIFHSGKINSTEWQTQKVVLKEADKHFADNVDADQFSCELCGRMYSTKQALEVHIRAIHIKSGFSCTICGKIIPVKKNPEIHMRYHTGDFP
uniref:C2H2-type domain-containing protein n=1 Tax=Glossina austeni TaxID=7395 RepID=A0A1A9VXT4_GLOAU